MGKIIELYSRGMDQNDFEDLKREVALSYDLNEGTDYEIGDGQPESVGLSADRDDPVLEIRYIDSENIVSHWGEESVMEALENIKRGLE